MSAVLNEPAGLRVMQESDLKELMDIERRAYEYPWTHGIFRDCIRAGYNCFVYVNESCIQGYGVVQVASGEAHILNVTVRPESQRRGFGRELITHFIDVATRHGADTILLEVRPSNLAAVGLYDGMGFNEVGVRKNYYPADKGREDALILAKVL